MGWLFSPGEQFALCLLVGGAVAVVVWLPIMAAYYGSKTQVGKDAAGKVTGAVVSKLIEKVTKL